MAKSHKKIRHHFISIRITTTKQKTSVGGDVEELERLGTAVGMKKGTNAMENSMAVSQKVRIPCNPAISLLSIYPTKMKADSEKYLYIHDYSSIIHNSETVKATQCPPMDEWISKT